MRTYDYFQVCDAVDAFMGDHAGDFDRTALINVLFEEVPTHPESHSEFTEREYRDAEIQACDVTQWVSAYVPTDLGETMLAERWFTSPEHGPVHVGAWEDPDGHVSLTLATVQDGGDDLWEPSSKVIADTLKPETLGAFDRAYGSRKAWEADLATVERMIKAS